MAIGDVPLTPIIDTVTGSVTEIGRIFLRTLTAAVNGLAPIDAAYWTSRPAGVLSAEVNLGALPSGYLKINTAVGEAVPATVVTIPQTDVTGLTGALAGKATLPIAQSDVTNLTADLALKAPLASPALTGTPTAPTATAGTTTTQIATTAFAGAAATAAIAGLAPLASPALTGTPTAPTAAPGTNTTQIATTAFARAADAAAVAGLAPLASPAFTGVVLVNTANPLAGQFTIASDLATHQGMAIQNLNAGNAGNFVVFFNSATGVAGNIAQNGASAIVYGNTSDARLKTDRGPAVDLAALRAVVVHDFTWTADGIPDRGVFAQDVAALFPRAVIAGTDETTADGTLVHPWMADYSKFVADLIVGWQQHDATIADLRAELADLRARLEDRRS